MECLCDVAVVEVRQQESPQEVKKRHSHAHFFVLLHLLHQLISHLDDQWCLLILLNVGFSESLEDKFDDAIGPEELYELNEANANLDGVEHILSFVHINEEDWCQEHSAYYENHCEDHVIDGVPPRIASAVNLHHRAENEEWI